jgi:hypothetical protein
MSITDIVADCQRLGIGLSAEPNGTLAVEFDTDPPAELLENLRRNKAAIFQVLAGHEEAGFLVWDETEGKRLVSDALARHAAIGWPGDPQERRERGQQLDRIDILYLARDLDELHVAVATFLAEVRQPTAAT